MRKWRDAREKLPNQRIPSRHLENHPPDQQKAAACRPNSSAESRSAYFQITVVLLFSHRRSCQPALDNRISRVPHAEGCHQLRWLYDDACRRLALLADVSIWWHLRSILIAKTWKGLLPRSSVWSDSDAIFVGVEAYGLLLSQCFTAARPRHPIGYYALQVSLKCIFEADNVHILSAPFATGPHALHRAFELFQMDGGIINTTMAHQVNAGVWTDKNGRNVVVIGQKCRSHRHVVRNSIPFQEKAASFLSNGNALLQSWIWTKKEHLKNVSCLAIRHFHTTTAWVLWTFSLQCCLLSNYWMTQAASLAVRSLLVFLTIRRASWTRCLATSMLSSPHAGGASPTGMYL